MSGEPAKILRIGVVQLGSGKVTETRLIKRRDTVTVGAGPKNTFALPGTDLAPSFTLFEMRGGQYHLHFTERMEGKLSVGDEPQVDFHSLVTQGLARRTGDGTFSLLLNEQMKGKVTLGGNALLFQFIAPPPEPAKMVLPEGSRGGWRNVDRLFYAIFACSLAIHFGLVSAVSGRGLDEEVSIDEIPDRFAKLIIPEKPITPPKSKESEKTAADQPKKEKPKEAPKKEKPPQDDAAKAAAAAARRAKIAQQVAKQGLLKLIGADSDNGHGAIDDVLGSGSSNQDIASALAGMGGVGVANADSIGAGGRKGGGSGKAAGIGDLATQGGGNVGIGGKAETRVRSSVSTSAPEVESSTLDRDAVARYVKSRIKAIQSCYERELKLEPTLKGKLAVRITINTQGKVSDTEVDEDTLHSDAVISCIKGLIRFWKFPFTPDSDAAVQFSWNFVSSS
jgi:hypothetical protein